MALWWEIAEADKFYEFQEPLTAHGADFGPKNEDLRQENAFYWDISVYR
jgi:hypothetical protein